LSILREDWSDSERYETSDRKKNSMLSSLSRSWSRFREGRRNHLLRNEREKLKTDDKWEKMVETHEKSFLPPKVLV